MRFQRLAACALALCATPALADIEVHHAYIRASMPGAPTAAAFMVLVNTGPDADRLIGVASDAADRVELHTHVDAGNGVMQMRPVEGGLDVPAGGEHVLQRGGDHVMFMGMAAPLAEGGSVRVTLTFEAAGDVVVDVPVNLGKEPDLGAMDHGSMDHGSMDHGTMGHEGMAPGN